MMSGVSSRTRSKNVPLFHSSSSKRRKSDKDISLDSVSGSKRIRVEETPFDDSMVITIDHYEEDEQGWKPENPITIDSDDEEDDVRKEVKVDETGGSCHFDNKDEIFIDSDESDEEHSVDSDDDDDSDASEEDETSDEDFNVDGQKEISDNDEDSSSSSSYDDGDDDDDVEEEEEVEEKKKKPSSRKYFNVVEELAREVIDGKSESCEISPPSVNNNDNDNEGENSDYGSVTISTTFDPMKGSSSSSTKLNEASKTHKEKSVEMEVKNDSHDVIVNVAEDSAKPNESVNLCNDVNVAKAKDSSMVSENVNVCDSDEGKEKQVKDLGVGGVSLVQSIKEEMKDLENQKMMENKGEDYEGRVNIANGKKKESMENFLEKLNKKDSMKNEPTVLEVKDDGANWREPSVFVEAPQTIWSLKKVHKVQMTKEEEEERKDAERLWEEMEMAKLESEAESMIGNLGRNRNSYSLREHVKGLRVGGVSSVQTKQNKVKDYKGRVNICNGKKKESMDRNGVNQREKPSLAELFTECYWNNKNDITKNDPIVLEVNDTHQPPVYVEAPQRIWSLKKVEKVQKTKEEEELEKELEANEVIWEEMESYIRESDAEAMIGNLETNSNRPPLCEHDIILDEQIGLYCKRCGDVITEIKYISPLVLDRFPNEGLRKSASIGGDNVSHFDGSHFDVSDDSSKANCSHNGGTVWDKIPDVKQTLYPHQQEGFEFIWKNLAGSIELRELKNANPRSEGGCIISHAPGTGKTRLTIVFLKEYLKVFPKCLPIIVAPASLLPTWEDEFKKWDIGVPFHNLNNLELSCKETEQHSMDTMRMAKLISWYKEKSILGISYHLYEKLAGGGEYEDDKKKKHASAKKRTENGYLRKALLESPGLLILDEGHTPRNEKSLIWQVLSEVQAPKRILLSGTPFQNNFMELYNILSLVKPSFPNTVPHELKDFCQKRDRKKVSKKWTWEPASSNATAEYSSDDKIKKLKFLMDPFVHVHKGEILQKKLRGLRDCMLILKPDNFQKRCLESIKSGQSTFISEPKLTSASVHPSLLLECNLLDEEESALDKDRLEKLRLDPNSGVKTKFLVEFVKLCACFNEKVLVFSELLGPLRLIKEQLISVLSWTEKDVLYMDGQIDLKDKQSLIHSFNEEKCQAKIMLASTRACSEGISLVGASRVVLLDVVWNPSVERQAVSRAYRIGQKRIVYTYHLLTEGTNEYDKYWKQAEKERLSELVFSEKHVDNDESKKCVADIEDKILDLMCRHKTLKDMFVKCVVQPKEQDLVESFGY